MAWRLLNAANLLLVTIRETLPCHFENISYPVGLRWSGIVPHTAACGTEKYLKEPWEAMLEMLLGHEPHAAFGGQWKCLVGALCHFGGPQGRRRAARDLAILSTRIRGCLHLFQPYTSSCHDVQVLLCPNWKEPALTPCLPYNEFFNRATKRKSLFFVKW